MINLLRPLRWMSALPGSRRPRSGLHRWCGGLALGLALLASPAAAQAAGASTSAVVSLPVGITFTRGAHLVTEPRLVPATDPARASMLALLAGPTAGDATEVPAGTRLLGLALRDGTATVDLSAAFQRVDGDPAIPLCLAQVVETLTQFPDIQRVVLEVDGQPIATLGGDGLMVPPVLDRSTIARLLPLPAGTAL